MMEMVAEKSTRTATGGYVLNGNTAAPDIVSLTLTMTKHRVGDPLIVV